MKTKKNKLSNLLKLGVLLFGVSLLLLNCEKQNFEPEIETTKGPFAQKFVSLSEIPKVKQLLPKKLKSIYQRKTAELNDAIFDESNILEVIDTLNNANYSFNFLLPTASKGQLFNLIIGKNKYGEIQTPFVLKYTCDEAYVDDFIANNYDFGHFKGTISLHKYTDYFEKDYFSKTTNHDCTEFDQFGDPIPCDINPVDGRGTGGSESNDGGFGGIGTGNNNTGTGGNISGGGSGACELEGLYVNGCGASNSAILHLADTCGGNLTIASYYFVWNCSSARLSKSSTDCPPCTNSIDGGIGINTTSVFMMRVTLKSVLNLRGAELAWVAHDDNITEVGSVYAFLQRNEVDGVYFSEVVSFVGSLIKAKASNNYSDFFALDVFNRDPYSVWKTLSQAEKNLIKKYPHQAYGIFKNRKIAEDATKTKFGFNGRNDKSDAFRHAYYNVINTSVVGIDIAKLFSDAHESETPTSLAKEKQMDLFNNNIGHQSINSNGSLSANQFVNLIYQKLLNGDLRYLSPLGPVIPPLYGITNLTQLTPTNQ